MKYKKPKTSQDFLNAIEEVQKQRGRGRSTLLDEIVAEVKANADFLKEQARRYKEMHEKYQWLIKYKYILNKLKEVQAKNKMEISAIEELKASAEPLLGRRSGGWRMKIDTIAGVIDSENCVRFERLIFRITRGIFLFTPYRQFACDVFKI